MDTLKHSLIPENKKGKATDIEHSIDLDNREEAIETFRRARKRLLNVNIWHDLSGFGGATFLLRDQNGKEAGRLAETGDYIQIDVLGPSPLAGDGYDWVYVEEIEDRTNDAIEEEGFGMRLRSCKNPNKPGKDIAHFFTGDATSTFIIKRNNNTVYSSYHGRNEVLNTDTEKLIDTVRNVVVGAGAVIGISELHWSGLIHSFLEKEL